MSRRRHITSVYHGGAYYGGWQCSDCRREFPHRGHPLPTFARLLAHMVSQHHRLPRPSGLVRWEWSR